MLKSLLACDAVAKEARTPDYVKRMEQFTEATALLDSVLPQTRGVKEVTDEDSASEAAGVLAAVAKATKKIDQLRLAATAPYRGSTETINTEFKELLSPVQAVETRLREEIKKFEEARRQREEDEARQRAKEQADAEEAARKQREAHERAVEEAAKADEPPPPPPEPIAAPAPAPAPREKATRVTGAGTISTKTVWKWEIIDAALVPAEYRVIDETALTKAVKGGARSIPGVRIYPDESISVR